MWCDEKDAKKVGEGTHVAFRFDNLRVETEDQATVREKILAEALAEVSIVTTVEMVPLGEMPDQGNRVRHQATVIGTLTDKCQPLLKEIAPGPSDGMVKFLAIPKVGTIGNKEMGNMMAGFTKAPFRGGRFIKDGIAQGAIMCSRASSKPRLGFVNGVLRLEIYGCSICERDTGDESKRHQKLK